MTSNNLTALLERLPVFPVWSRTEHGHRAKAPCLADPLAHAARDPAALAHWRALYPGCAFAAFPGSAGYAVLDLDHHEGRPDGRQSLAAWELDHGFLPDTLEVSTPSGGRHLWFRDAGNALEGKKDAWLPGADVHGGPGLRGGYVLLPGQTIENGAYTIVGDLAPADLPAVLADAVNAARHAAEAARRGAALPAATAVEADYIAILQELAGLKAIPAGNRDNTLFALAAGWKNRGVSEAGLLALLQQLDALGKLEQPPEDPIGDADFRRIARSAAHSAAVPAGNLAVGALLPDLPEAPAPSGAARRDQLAAALARSRYTADRLAAEDLPDLKWIVPEFLPAGLAILAGPPKTGKSYLILQLLTEITKAPGAGTFLGKPVGGRRALYYALEDSKRRLKARFAQLYGGGWTPPAGLTVRHVFPPLDDEGLWCLKKDIEDARPDVLVIDTWQKVRRAPGGDGDAYQKEYAELSTLQSLATAGNLLIVLVHHFKKYKRGDIEDGLDKLNGSAALAGTADTIMLFERPARGESATLAFSGRDTRDAVVSLVKREPMGWAFSAENTPAGILGIIPETESQRKLLDVFERGRGTAETAQLVQACPELTPEAVRQTLLRWINRGVLLRERRGTYTLSRAELLTDPKTDEPK